MSDKPKQASPVLIAIYHDGYVEVYAEKHIDAHIVLVPYIGSAEGEILAEQYVGTNLPPRHRAIYAPGLIRASKLGRKITPQDIADTQTNMALLRTVDTLCGVISGEATTCTL